MNPTNFLEAISYELFSSHKFDLPNTNYRILKAARTVGPHYLRIFAYLDLNTDTIHRVEIDSEKYGMFAWSDPSDENKLGFLVLPEDGWSYTDCEHDIIDKISAAWNNRTFDTDVVMTIHFSSDEDSTKLCDLAAKRGITVDELLLEAIMEYIEEKKEPVVNPVVQAKKKKKKKAPRGSIKK